MKKSIVISQQLVTDIHDEGDCLILHEWTLLRLRRLRSSCCFLVLVLLDPTLLQLASDCRLAVWVFSLCNSLRYKIPAL